MHYQMYRDVSGQWRWYLQSANGKKVADSGEAYHNEADCFHAIGLVKGSSQAPIYRQ